jgi:phosphatidylethanolamine/phosphatidyl-N-methylethanolamine N-methyltransferase
MNKTATFYNRFSLLYPVVDSFLARYRKKLISKVNEQPTGRLLEIGVGTGAHLQLYKEHIITGIDISPGMLKKAKQPGDGRLQLLEMNGENLEFAEGSFDYVVVSYVLAVSGNPDKMLSEAYRVMKTGGKLYVLNHFTPGNVVQYVDKCFVPFARLLHFRPVFRQEDIEGFKMFQLTEEIPIGIASYFKLLIYTKP